MEAIIAEWWIKWLCGIIAGGFVWIIRLLWKRQRATELGIQALLRDRLVQSYYHYADRGNISLHGLENVEAMYRQYFNLGGNGTITKLVEDMRTLEVVDT